MADVTLSASMRANLLSLQNTASLMGTTQYRLATGLKVNSALDNPSAFFAAQSLNNRAGDLSALLDGMGQSVQTLKAADEGIKGLTKLVEQAKAIAETARGKSQSGGSTTGTIGITPAQQADMTSGTLLAASDTLTINVGGQNHTVTYTSGGLQGIIDQINALDGVAAEAVTDGANVNLRVYATGAEALTLGGNIQTALGLAASSPVTYDTSAEEAQFDDIRSQINQFITDTGYRGVNLLNGDTLRTVFNEGGTSSMDVVGVTRDAAGLGLSAADFSSLTSMEAAINAAKSALTTLRDDAKAFGNNLSVIQTRQDFTKNLINVLKDGATNLTIADTNEEGANMLALQTQQQLGIQSLSLASQANQSVLRLFS